MRLLVFDTETSMNKKLNEIVQLAYVIAESGKEKQGKSIYFKPEYPCLSRATVCHGLTNSFLSGQRDIKESLLEALTPFVEGTEETVFSAFNISFDLEVIENNVKEHLGGEFRRPKYWFDAMRLARHLIPEDEIGTYSLDAVYFYLKTKLLGESEELVLEEIGKMRSTHDALVDVEMTLEVINILTKEAIRLGKCVGNLVSLCEFANSDMIIYRWPFGEHYDKPIQEVLDTDMQYARWFLGKTQMHEKYRDLLYTIKQIISRRTQ